LRVGYRADQDGGMCYSVAIIAPLVAVIGD